MKKRTKVAFHQNGLGYGGTDTFVINLCRCIDQSLFDVTVINSTAIPRLRERAREIESVGIPVVHTCFIKTLRHHWMLYRILRRGHFDTYHTNVDLFNGPGLMVAWLAGVKNRVNHSHNTNRVGSLGRKSLYSRLYEGIMRLMIRLFATRHVGCSPDALPFLAPHFDASKAAYPTVIYNGIDFARFGQAMAKRDATRSEMGLEGKHVVINVGNLGPQKNPLMTARVFIALAKRMDDVRLLWVGIGEAEDEVKRMFAQAGVADRVMMLGQRDDVPLLMGASDMMLFPSAFEGLGIVAVEAQAAGLTVLASDRVPRLAQCGGIVYKSLEESPEAWALTAGDILMGKLHPAVNPELLSNFSMEHAARQMEKVYSCE